MSGVPRKVQGYFRYLPVPDEARRWGLWVVNAGYTLIPPHTPYPPLKHPDDHLFDGTRGRVLNTHTLVFITRGRGTFESDASGRVSVGAGDAIMVFPGARHRYRPDDETGWNEHWVEFDGPLAERLVAAADLVEAKPVVAIGKDLQTMQLLERIIEAIRVEEFGFHALLGALAFELMVRVSVARRRAERTVDSRMEALIKTACQRIHESDGRHIDLPDLARDLAVSYSWFRHAFRKVTGLSPGQYHLQLRLQRAARWLLNTDLPVSEIADKLQFESIYYFSRLFKAKTGLSPREYRSRNRSAGPS